MFYGNRSLAITGSRNKETEMSIKAKDSYSTSSNFTFSIMIHVFHFSLYTVRDFVWGFGILMLQLPQVHEQEYLLKVGVRDHTLLIGKPFLIAFFPISLNIWYPFKRTMCIPLTNIACTLVMLPNVAFY